MFMRVLEGLLVFGVVSAFLLAPVEHASGQNTGQAEPKQYNNQLKVTGVVLPAQHVIVDERGMITEILSNTEKDIMPTVYAHSLAKSNIIEMTPDIYAQYRQLVPEGQSQVGVLYKRIPGVYPTFPPSPILQSNEPNGYVPRLESSLGL